MVKRKGLLALFGAATASFAAPRRKPVVAGHPWVYAATLPPSRVVHAKSDNLL